MKQWNWLEAHCITTHVGGRVWTLTVALKYALSPWLRAPSRFKSLRLLGCRNFCSASHKTMRTLSTGCFEKWSHGAKKKKKVGNGGNPVQKLSQWKRKLRWWKLLLWNLCSSTYNFLHIFPLLITAAPKKYHRPLRGMAVSKPTV